MMTLYFVINPGEFFDAIFVCCLKAVIGSYELLLIQKIDFEAMI